MWTVLVTPNVIQISFRHISGFCEITVTVGVSGGLSFVLENVITQKPVTEQIRSTVYEIFKETRCFVIPEIYAGRLEVFSYDCVIARLGQNK